MMTIASVSFKISSFESTVVASARTILRVVAPACAGRPDPEMEDCNRTICNRILPAREITSIGVRLPRGALEGLARILRCTAYLCSVAFYVHQLRREHYFPLDSDRGS